LLTSEDVPPLSSAEVLLLGHQQTGGDSSSVDTRRHSLNAIIRRHSSFDPISRHVSLFIFIILTEIYFTLLHLSQTNPCPEKI
jgi:hypothetical protein